MPETIAHLKESGNAFSLFIPPINRDWEKVLHLGAQKKYKENELIMRGDKDCEHLMYVHSGRVRCEHPGLKGNLKVCFYAEGGSIIGEALAINDLPTVATFFASKDCIVYAFTIKTLQTEIIPKYPELAFNLMQTMAYKIRMYSLHLESITLNDIHEQICRICYSLLIETNALEKKPGISQQELADVLGVHRNTIVRAVKKLKEEGIISELSRSVLRVNRLEDLLSDLSFK